MEAGLTAPRAWCGGSELASGFNARLLVRDVLRAVAETTGVTVEDLLGPSRRRHVVKARAQAMAIVRASTTLSYPAIGRLFGGRDHTTVMNACRRVAGDERYWTKLSRGRVRYWKARAVALRAERPVLTVRAAQTAAGGTP